MQTPTRKAPIPVLVNQELAIRGVVASLKNEYVGVIDPAVIEEIVRVTVEELRGNARVQLYVPLLAHRKAHERLHAYHQQQAASAGGPPKAA